eukprot:g18583.t1
MFGSVTGALVCVPCVLFLGLYWERCSECNKPLHWWLLVHTVLLLLQTPVRVVFSASIILEERRHGANNAVRLELLVRKLTSAKAWKMSKCPGMYRLVIAVILTAIIRLLVTLVCFYQCFPIRPRLMGFLDRPTRPLGATEAQLEKLGSFEWGNASCAVCLSDFADGERCRRLPCGHVFHLGCIDKWLRKNRKCPLCLQDITAMKRKGE